MGHAGPPEPISLRVALIGGGPAGLGVSAVLVESWTGLYCTIWNLSGCRD